MLLGLHENVSVSVFVRLRAQMYTPHRPVWCRREGYWWITALTFVADPITALHLTLLLPSLNSFPSSVTHTHTPTHTRSQWETCPNSGWLGGPTCELLGLSVRRAEHIFNLTCLPIRGPFPAARGCKPERPQAYYRSQRFSKRLRTPRYLSFSHICPAGSGVKASPIRVVDVSLTLWCQDTGPQILQ